MRVNKKIIAGSLLLIIILVFIYFNFNNANIEFNSQMSKVCIEDKKCFVIEIADSDEERALGLGGRESLDENKGMLFVFEEEVMPGFWMKDMKFPIDIIWIDSNREIIGIQENLQPCSNIVLCPAVYPSHPIKYVLEINANLSDRDNITEGNIVKFSD